MDTSPKVLRTVAERNLSCLQLSAQEEAEINKLLLRGSQFPLPLVLSYCRIDRLGHHTVRILKANNRTNTREALSQRAMPGDVIIFGKYEPPTLRGVQRDGRGLEAIWVDTVMVVDRLVAWPTNPAMTPGRRRYRLSDPVSFAIDHLGILLPHQTHLWDYNLSDAQQGRHHELTDLPDHRIIVGRTNSRPESVSNLETSFVPLAELRENRPHGWYPVKITEPKNSDSPVQRELWKQLREFIGSVAGNRNNSGYITQFPFKMAFELEFELAKELCLAVVAQSGRDQGLQGTVAIPPLVPVPIPKRCGLP